MLTGPVTSVTVSAASAEAGCSSWLTSAGKGTGSSDSVAVGAVGVLVGVALGAGEVQQAPTSSSMLCGGMLVAMPTAMPLDPLASRFGNAAGSTTGSRSDPS